MSEHGMHTLRTSGAWLPWLLGTALGLPLLFAALCWAIYLWSARHVPDTIPASTDRAPATARAQYLAIETGGATRLRRLNPVTFWTTLIVDLRKSPRNTPPDLRLLMSAARLAQSRDTTASTASHRHLASIAWTIDVGRQWSFDQAVDTILAESHFGRDSIGVEAAARAYFGVPASALRPQESLALIALLKGPSWFSLDCNRERFETRYALLAKKLGHDGPAWTPATALSRLRPRACARGVRG
jgi:hypothetical protein